MLLISLDSLVYKFLIFLVKQCDSKWGSNSMLKWMDGRMQVLLDGWIDKEKKD